jgi:ferredoxin-type protein NapG
VKARTLLRPPGALPEGDFLKTCYHSGNCLQVCPVSAIKQYKSDDPDQNNTPYIDADLAACIACDAVYCTKSCPSGALAVIHDRREIRIGLARVSEFECIRNRGEDCTICVEKCPIGRNALLVGEDGRIQVVASGCTGCGLCQQHCPTFPKAIVVDPR